MVCNFFSLLQELPKLFVDKYGKRLREVVTLLVADGKKYYLNYCTDKHLLTNLNKFVEKYKIKENYVLFFDYVGNASFYISIFSPWCFDICNQIANKVVLKDIIGHTKEGVLYLKDEELVFQCDNSSGFGSPMLQDSNAVSGT